MQGNSPNFYPMSAAASRIVLALACANSPRFQPGNDCGRGQGYGRDNGVRTSRTTKGNIKAAGAAETRRFTDGSGRQVVEHRTADGRTFHEVTHTTGRKTFHQVHGPAATAKPKAAAAGQRKDGGGLADIPERPRAILQDRVDAVRKADKAVKEAEDQNTVVAGTDKGKVFDADGEVAAAKAVRDKAQASLDEIRPLAKENGIDFDRAVSEAGGTEYQKAERPAPVLRDFSPAEKDAIEFQRQKAQAALDAPRLAEEAKQAERDKKTQAEVAARDSARAKTLDEVTDKVRKGLKPEGEAVFRSGTKAQQKALLNDIQIGTGVHSEEVARQAVAKVLAERAAAGGAKPSAAAAAVAATKAPAGGDNPTPAEFARYRTPGGQDVRVGASGRIVAGPAGLLGKTPAEAGAVPEAEYHAGRAKAAAPAADPGARPGDKGFRPTPEQQRAADASAHPRPPGPSAAARAAARMGEKSADRPAAVGSRAATAVRESAGRAGAGTMGGMDKPGPASSETRYELADGTAVKLSVAPDPYDKSKAHVRVAKVDRQGRHSYTYHKAATAAAARAEYEDAKVKYRAALAAKGLKGEAETHR